MVSKVLIYRSATERRLNSFPHFKAAIVDDDGAKHDIHFMALFSKKTDAVPLMMLHGWPGTEILAWHRTMSKNLFIF